MAKNLVIVESPAKAKTIENYLGTDFTVASSYGHVRDLPKGDKAIKIDDNFEPTYTIPEDKEEVIKQLKKLVKDAEQIYLATDDDREGEAISWHLKEVLELQDESVRRIVFHEITKNAIKNAMESPRGIDYHLVNAQQARRILDRLVGYELSPVLWKKIQRGLSAGRVQSVAVRLVVEREREIQGFTPKSSFKVSARFDVGNGKVLKADLPKKFQTEEEARDFLEKVKNAEFTIKKLEKKPVSKKPAAPFTTSTLQQEASRKLGYSVAQTMTIAQRLYESGKITYMRTDSEHLSQEAQQNAAKEISKDYGQEYVKNRQFQTKSESAQEAHEAIRPTNFANVDVGGQRNEQKLYELIWKRAIASQMAEAQIERTTATIGISTVPQTLTATGEVIKFEGFLKVYLEGKDEDDEDEESKDMLPPLNEGQQLTLQNILARQGFSRHPPRYTEASLVKKLEEMDIGRPSTYAPTLSTVQKRGYVVKEDRDGFDRNYTELGIDATKPAEERQLVKSVLTEKTGTEKNKLFPTSVAMVVNDFLVNYFPNVIDYSFTAEVEKEFDEIARGQKNWDHMIKEFYEQFHPKVEQGEQVDRKKASSDRYLGIDPKSEKPVIARLGKFGPMVQIGDSEDEEKKFASLQNGQYLETISLEEALTLFNLPREVGDYEEEPVVVTTGRFGPYLKHKGKNYSLAKQDDPYSLRLERAIEIIEKKREIDANKYIKVFDENPDVQVLNGPYGPYIKYGKKNVKIPKDKEPEKLTLEECIELGEKAPEKKGRGRKGAGSTTSKSTNTASGNTKSKATGTKSSGTQKGKSSETSKGKSSGTSKGKSSGTSKSKTTENKNKKS